MIRTYDTAVLDRPTDTTPGPCPDCAGNGSVGRRVFGHNAPEPYVWETCGACSGTGEVPAEALVLCDECSAPVWADEVCTHQLGNLCPDHAPACVECTGVRGDQ